MTVLTRWEPFREFSTLQDRINRVFRESYSGASHDCSRWVSDCAGERRGVYLGDADREDQRGYEKNAVHRGIDFTTRICEG